VAGALAVRLWGIRHGLPYAYNADEDAHFVPDAVRMAEAHGFHPHYFANPPALTYALRLVFGLRWGGGVGGAWAADPGALFLTGRVLVAVLGAAAAGLLAVAGARLFDRATGLLAGALVAVGFLPVFYSHLALNDVPAMAAVCLALVGAARLFEGAGPRWALAAGGAAGLAVATKYTGGVALVALVGAVVLGPGPTARRLGLGLGAAALAFALADPYAILDPAAFWHGVHGQADISGHAKPGQTLRPGLRYYGWSLTWGLGWLPTLAAAAGAALLVARDRRRAVVVLGPLVAFALAMGLQGRYFGRWLMPVLPFVALLAAHAALVLARRAPRPALAAGLLAAAVCLQGAWASVRSDRVLSRPDARGDARGWMLAHVPRGALVVADGSARPRWLAPWRRYPVPRGDRAVLALRPALLAAYRRRGACWVVVGSTQRGRAEADPARARNALAYYAALGREATLVHRAAPWPAATRTPAFNFDWSFQYYGPAYDRPGEEVSVYRLRACTQVSDSLT
jgi:4-amino-4-deoxy-L-arabinose transferase-like glycosyltransferase